MVGRVEIRDATRKESTAEKAKRDKKGAKKKDSKETESREPKKGAPPKTSESSVKKESSAKKDKSVEELRTSSQDDSQSDGPALKILQKAYARDIKDEVPLDLGSGIHIMTEETANAMGYKEFQPTTRMIRLADQIQRKPLGILKDIWTIFGGVVFSLNYTIIKPLTKMGYDVLIDRPWFYGAKVKSDWHTRTLQFRDLNNKEGPKITVPWERIRMKGRQYLLVRGTHRRKDLPPPIVA
ncbi:hypothetical protein AXG93_601s1030 [Marchantia polymorpha subsp. ruderalis]|uniref:Uncharacterized protein n=1 Tax=Marchantia polymorpha subsp. ruderalis TaxID=1480154 RepID=A0A176WKN0_MARPO|nr:hypothetical protein AXG93_601s1030 [Marchantia polymorpha subsp. ruderalis]